MSYYLDSILSHDNACIEFNTAIVYFFDTHSHATIHNRCDVNALFYFKNSLKLSVLSCDKKNLPLVGIGYRFLSQTRMFKMVTSPKGSVTI